MLETAGSLVWLESRVEEERGCGWVAVRVTDRVTGSHWEGPGVFMWTAAPGRRGCRWLGTL